ncbi:GNAT family N-acetyltransferase [Siphonobacter aquaeclarae]|jgi:GNAT superfamily N-acetyltransferase|uniref:Acetyltransferase (GNAT) domain-containing protein n=1 Tax=Siphonobacter aquaeclarae TaxID=563176 RepID=A0A1G9XR38_9BACT|nr:GNAT family N-acetyltransferase [Siphonobacter aquaeclarae]MBO9637116.1 GNAT family N-acetyltransferase [Siphonobacter aquaeclarae]SDM98655.1 Acetyltransferase (GNAT) domain-containing protein [Siphonobacter aquaeclarae]
MNEYKVQIASKEHLYLAEEICWHMEESAKQRGTGIAKRSPEYIRRKMEEGKAIVAMTVSGQWVGFCYIETWDHGKFVANSGLIVHPDHRKSGIAKMIKEKAFQLSRTKYPNARIIGITTSLAVMKINSDLGYKPTTFSELPVDEAFWKGCSSCVNFDVLTRTGRKHCLCTGMMFDPSWEKEKERKPSWNFLKNAKIYERWNRIKQRLLLRHDENEEIEEPVL